jgi:type IV fimbrial biogenesis protein FimT
MLGPMKTPLACAHTPRVVRGLTLIELMVVIVVLAVLVTLVAPSMRGMMARQRVRGVNAELVTDLQLARSEVNQRSGTGTTVAVTFGGNAQMTCYSLHTGTAACDCTQSPGSVCAAPSQEIKLMQFPRAAGVTVAASSPSGSRVQFAPPQGLATPGDLVIDVQDATSGQLRTSVNGLGRPSVCSPDGSITGVPTC